MADEQKLATDANGIVIEGRFAGYHISDVLKYAETLEAAPSSGETPPARPRPEEALAASSSARVDNAQALMFQRLEADDEAQFASSVSDYETYRADIGKAKQTMPPQSRVQRGVHQFLYVMIKTGKDPKLMNTVLGKAEPVEQPPVTPVSDEVPAAEPVADEVPAQPAERHAPATPPVAPPPTPKPKAVPVAAAPTPSARREPATPQRKPKLVATEKIARAASAFGMSTEAYLFKLEDQGLTQEDIAAAETRTQRSSQRRETVYDRAIQR